MTLRFPYRALMYSLCVFPWLAWAEASVKAEDPGPSEYYTVQSPEWLRMSSVVSAIHTYPPAHVLPGFLMDHLTPLDGEKVEFRFVMPSQGLPGIMYQPSIWAGYKTSRENSVISINYRAMEEATRMVHRKGNWIIPHVPASSWWSSISEMEPPRAGAVYINMMLLANNPPPDGFNFDAELDKGADMDGIRRMAEKILPGGKYVMLGEYGDHAAYNSHLSYLYGPKPRPWAEDLHGQLYIGYGVRGLDHNVVWKHGHDVSSEEDKAKSAVPQDVRLRLGLWDAMFWGGVTPWFQPFPGGPLPADEVVELMKLVQLFQAHADLQGLVKNPRRLPAGQVLQPDLGVNHFNGADPAYFRTEDSPGADKQIYTFKTGGYEVALGHPDYYVTLPPTIEKGPAGDLLSVPHEEGFHWISSGINGSWRTPARREGDRVILGASEGVAVYGQTPQPGETVYMIRYREILDIQRAGPARLVAEVDKNYQEPVFVELGLSREGEPPRSRVISRPVINGRAVFDLERSFGMQALRTDDVATIRLLRERTLSDWHILPLLCDEVVLESPEHWAELEEAAIRPSPKLPEASPLILKPNETLLSNARYTHATLEFRARFPGPGALDSWIGFMEKPSDGWAYNRFTPGDPKHLLAWNYRMRDRGSPLEAFFDNASGLVERSGGMRIQYNRLPGDVREVNANAIWGDYLWSYANSRIDAADLSEFNTFRIEWQRLWQRWYINNRLVYERRLVQNEPLPLLIHNAGYGDIEIEWMRIAQPRKNGSVFIEAIR